MLHGIEGKDPDIGGRHVPTLGRDGAVKGMVLKAEVLKWRGWLCHLFQSRTQKRYDAELLHRVFATDGVNLYESVPQGLE